MKKLLPLLLIPFLVFSSCKKDNDDDSSVNLEVVKRQRATLTYYGATWCGPCGSSGDPAKEHIESTFGDDVVILNSQGAWQGDNITSLGDFGNSFGNAFHDFLKTQDPSHGISAPYQFWSAANHQMSHGGFYSNNSDNATESDATVNSILSDVVVSVGIAASATNSGDSAVTINTKTKFYSALGEHYIGVYLLEDGVMANQVMSGGAPDAITAHNNVIRFSAFEGNSLGAQSIGTSFTADQEVTGSYTIPLWSGWNISNLQVAVVIWSSTNADGISNSIIVDVN